MTIANTHAEVGRRNAGLVMTIVALASFMDVLDVGIVNVVIPVMQKDLGGTYGQGQWFLVAYVLSFAVVLVTGGRLGDIFGRKLIFLIGVAGFTVLSAGCALATSADELIVLRLAQGAFAALMTPQVFALLQVLFKPERRAVGFMIYGGVLNLGQLSAPVLGGLLTAADIGGLGWRAIFLVNIPVGIVTFIGAAALVEESKAAQRLRVDLVGMVLIGIAAALLMVPLQQGNSTQWPLWRIAMLVAVVPLSFLIVWYESRQGRNAVMPTSLFAMRSFAAATLLVLLVFCTISSGFLIIVWLTQVALGWTTLQTALSLIGFVIGLCGVSAAVAMKVERFGRRTVATGAIIIAVGFAVLSTVIASQGTQVQIWQLLLALVVVGGGLSLVIGVLVNTQLYDVPADQAGAAGGVLSATIQLGSALGVGVITLLFFGFLAHGADSEGYSTVPALRQGLASAGVNGADQDRIAAAFRTCFDDRASSANPFDTPDSCRTPDLSGPVVADAMRTATGHNFVDAASSTLWWPAGLLLVAAPLSGLLPRRRSPAAA